MTVRIYHNHDAGAPTLDFNPGSMIDVLDAVLVNGYGDKQPLGWTKEYHNGLVAVYRNDPLIPGSTGCYLRVDDSYRSGTTSYSQVQIYKTMSDINTGTDVAPNVNQSGYQQYIYWHKNYSTAMSPKQWTIIGDERTFYLNMLMASSYPTSDVSERYSGVIYGAGDFVSYVPGNEWNYMLFGCGHTTTSSSYYFPYSPGTTNQRTAVIGRSQALIPDRCAWIDELCLWGNPGDSTDQPDFSVYTGLESFMPALILENQDGRTNTGHLRGAYWHLQAGSNLNGWFKNMGKLPEDPTGPDLRMLNTSSDLRYNSLIVKEYGWDD